MRIFPLRAGGESTGVALEPQAASVKLAGATLAAALVFAILLVACGSGEAEPPLDQVTVQLTWYHQAQFAGLYAAVERGFYAEEGLEVTLLPKPAPRIDVVGRVNAGEADFGISAAAGVITSRAHGGDAVAIAIIYQRLPLVFMTLPGSGIVRPSDFAGRSIRMTDPTGTAMLNSMLAHEGVDPKSIRVLDVGYDLAPFFAGEVDIWPAFVTNAVLTARAAGYDVNLIMPGDYGIHFYGDTVITTNRLIELNPGLVLRFLRATLRGWEWASRHAEEASELGLLYDSDLDAAHQRAQLRASLPLVANGEYPIGWMREEDWEAMSRILLEQGLVDEAVPAGDVHTMEFLRQIFGGNE